MLKNYKVVALKTTQGTGEDSYTFNIKENNVNEALVNAEYHISNSHSASANYHIELKLIG